MAVSQRLVARQTQTITMTPELRQSIGLLKLTTAELKAFVEQEIEKNPFLELAAVDADSVGSGGDTPKPKVAEPDKGVEGFQSGSEPLSPISSVASSLHTGLNGIEQHAKEDSMREALLRQIRLMDARPQLINLATRLVEELDDDGYLRADMKSLADELETSSNTLQAALRLVQRCDPAGIGARSLLECFALQLAEAGRLTETASAVLRRLHLFTKGGAIAIAKEIGISERDAADIISEIRKLDHDPGARFRAQSVEYITPDITVGRNNLGGWHVEILPDALPRVIVNQTFAAEVSSAGTAAATYVAEHTRRANWLIRSLEQRANTVLRVASEIVRVQEGFLTHGPRALKPLTLRTVAEALSLHESTVSRVTRGKYLVCERGTFELKYFFSKAIPTIDGIGAHSARSVQDRIKVLVAEETPGSPLSDGRIAELLKADGIEIARRTIAKYREIIGIPPSHTRRRLAARRAATPAQ